MTDRPKVVTMNPAPDKMTEAVEAMKRSMDATLDYQILVAKIRRKAYLAHIDEGFTPEQALELVKKLW